MAIARLIQIAPPALVETGVDRLLPVLMAATATALFLGSLGHLHNRRGDLRDLTHWSRGAIRIVIIICLLVVGYLLLTIVRLAGVTARNQVLGAALAIPLIALLTCASQVPWKSTKEIWFVVSMRLGLFFTIFTAATFTGFEVAPKIAHFWQTFSAMHGGGMFTLAAGLAVISWVPINLLYPTDYAKWHAIRKNHEDLLDGFLWLASQQGLLTQINLLNGKVYIGYAVKLPANLRGIDDYIRFQPVISGHRTSEKHRLVLDTFYHPAYQRLTRSTEYSVDELRKVAELRKTIAVEQIWSIGEFDPSVRRIFHADAKRDKQLMERLRRKRPDTGRAARLG